MHKRERKKEREREREGGGGSGKVKSKDEATGNTVRVWRAAWACTADDALTKAVAALRVNEDPLAVRVFISLTSHGTHAAVVGTAPSEGGSSEIASMSFAPCNGATVEP